VRHESALDVVGAALSELPLLSGHYFELKLLVDGESDDDMWFAYDTTSYDSKIELP